MLTDQACDTLAAPTIVGTVGTVGTAGHVATARVEAT